MDRESGPALSVVLLAQLSLEQLEATVSHLRAQDLAERMELVIVTPLPRGETPYATTPIGRVSIVVTSFESRSEGYAAGIRSASAPLVALGEDHAFPQDGWARALVDAHSDPAVAVVLPAFLNGNPSSPLSWGNLVLSYGAWLAPIQPQALDEMTVPNACFKRNALLGLDSNLESLLLRDGDLVGALRTRGFRIELEPAARVRHLNPSRIVPTMRLRFHAGRLYAAARARGEGWSTARRAVYCVGIPLVPPLRLARITRTLRKRGHPLTARLVVGLCIALLIDAAGQFAGYARGPGESGVRLVDVELHGRTRLLNRRDRLALDLEAR